LGSRDVIQLGYDISFLASKIGEHGTAKGVSIEDNPSACKQLDVLGFCTSSQHTVKICTDHMARLYGESSVFRMLLNQLIAHEAVRAAQGCRQRRRGKPGPDLPAERLYGLPMSVRADI
jgi:hypothetical protein